MADTTTTEDVTKLAEKCIDIKGEVSNSDVNWVQFIRDHKQYILNKCTTKEVDVYYMLKYKYRPTHFMLDNNYQWQMTWIMMFINDIPNESYFNENITSLKMFEASLIIDLYRIYESSSESSE